MQCEAKFKFPSGEIVRCVLDEYEESHKVDSWSEPLHLLDKKVGEKYWYLLPYKLKRKDFSHNQFGEEWT